jgi:hypothetical protein
VWYRNGHFALSATRTVLRSGLPRQTCGCTMLDMSQEVAIDSVHEPRQVRRVSRGLHGSQFGPHVRTVIRSTAWSGASHAFHKAGLFPLEGAISSHRAELPSQQRHQERRRAATTATGCANRTMSIARLGWRMRGLPSSGCLVAVTWDHGARTAFALAAHKTLACDQCHQGDFGKTLSGACRVMPPTTRAHASHQHQPQGFPIFYQLCHRRRRRRGGRRGSIIQRLRWRRTRRRLQCVSSRRYLCRDSARLRGLPSRRLDRATEPSHAAAGFPLACDVIATPTRAGQFRMHTPSR